MRDVLTNARRPESPENIPIVPGGGPFQRGTRKFASRTKQQTEKGAPQKSLINIDNKKIPYIN